jgi:outer membrane protein insertion porin family
LRQLFALRFLEPYFLDSNWTFAFDIYNSTRTYESFARNSSGGDLTFGYPLGDYTRTFLTYKLENVDVSTRAAGFLFSGSSRLTIPRSAVIYNLQSSGITSSLRASLSYDTRDNRLFPSRGSFEDISVEVADRVLGSQNVFARYSAFARYYQPIWGPFLLKLNAEIGFVHSRLANGVPIFERYYLGGIYDIRGFRERSLSPRIKAPVAPDPNADLFEFPIGGNLQLILNAEIEFPIFEKVGIRGVVFLDAGNAFNTESRYCQMSAPIVTGKADPCVPFSPAMLRFSAGFGFRWFSPIGPLRFEWGIPLDRQPGEESIVFEFTIGNFF